MTAVHPEDFARGYVTIVEELCRRLPGDDLSKVLRALEAAHRAGKQVFFIGNGGSAATASHWASDMTWGLTRVGIRPMRAVALTENVALLTAIANDASYEEIFTRQLEAYATSGDLLVAISASGNSPNVVRAVEWARRADLTVVGILGMDGGKVGPLADIALVVRSPDYGPIEDMHMLIDHLALAYLREVLGH